TRGPYYSGDSSGWSGRQARQGVQPASLAAATVVLSRSLSPMKRMRMQLALWYLGTPGTTVTSVTSRLDAAPDAGATALVMVVASSAGSGSGSVAGAEI